MGADRVAERREKAVESTGERERADREPERIHPHALRYAQENPYKAGRAQNMPGAYCLSLSSGDQIGLENRGIGLFCFDCLFFFVASQHYGKAGAYAVIFLRA